LADDGQPSDVPDAAASRGVRATLAGALDAAFPTPGPTAGPYADPLQAARAWLAHVEGFLAWVVAHPDLVGIHADARRLLSELRGGDEPS
jgi:hypothetical protein